MYMQIQYYPLFSEIILYSVQFPMQISFTLIDLENTCLSGPDKLCAVGIYFVELTHLLKIVVFLDLKHSETCNVFHLK